MIAGFMLAAMVAITAHDDPPVKPAEPDPKVVKAELEWLQGTWTLASLSVAGNELTEDKFKGSVVVFEGNEQKLLFNDQARGTYTITLRPDARPAELDLVSKAGPRKGGLIPAIYKLEGDTLTICTDTRVRPKTFATVAGPGQQGSLAVYKKRKPEKTEP